MRAGPVFLLPGPVWFMVILPILVFIFCVYMIISEVHFDDRNGMSRREWREQRRLHGGMR